MKKKLKAFTLAEVLITLAIVGVVAAITMPALIANIQERVKTARIQNIKQKFSKATDKMLSVTTLNGYASTMEFVNELQNHLKIAKICTNDKLNECWPTEDVILNDEGKKWKISKTIKAGHLKLPKSSNLHQYDDTVGIVTADGTAMILSYDKLCNIDENQTIIWDGEKSSTTNCIGAVFDWNGSKMPNKLGEDVITFNAGGLGSNCVFEVDGKCYGAPKLVPKASCSSIMDTHGIKYCGAVINDYWAGAVAECGHVDNLISSKDVMTIASELYGVDCSRRGCNSNTGAILDLELAASYGFSGESFDVFSNKEKDGWEATTYAFRADSLGNIYGSPRKYQAYTICKLEE